MVDLADGHIHVSTRRDVLIVQIDVGLDDDLAALLVPAVAAAVAAAGAVVLDIDQVTLLDRTALDAVCDSLDSGRDAGSEVSTAVHRGRPPLRAPGARTVGRSPSGTAVFSSVPDALQARAFVESGYGHGWMPSPGS